jgi:hypothetical protein
MDRRRALLVATLGFVQIERHAFHGHARRGLAALHAWLDNWRGVGLIVEGMRRQRYRVSLREIDAWVASFRSHPMVSDDGFASAPTPWEAVQRAAWAAIKRRLDRRKPTDRQGECERRPSADLALHPDSSAVKLDELPA